MSCRSVFCVIAACALTGSLARAQQPIDPVDFRPFVDGAHWIVRQPPGPAPESMKDQF